MTNDSSIFASLSKYTQGLSGEQNIAKSSDRRIKE